MAYQSIHVQQHDGYGDEPPPGGGTSSRSGPSARRGLPLTITAFKFAGAVIILWAATRLFSSGGGHDARDGELEGLLSNEELEGMFHAEEHDAAKRAGVLASVPSGVNLGGWLSLEDWFYVGDDGAVEVATPDPPSDLVDSGRWKGGGAASCLPPLHVDASTGPRWSSETDLFGGLADHYKEDGKSESESSLGPWGRAYRTVHAARSSYMDYDAEMPLLREIGVEYVRVPVSWCWTEYDPSLMVVKDLNPMAKGDGFIYMDDDEVRDKFACEDPFHKGVYWPAVPKPFLAKFLRACAKHGLGATLDIHTYPGGTSVGTFSGVWPRYARFWSDGDAPALDGTAETDVGRDTLKSIVSWLESLAVSDPAAFEGLRALSPMNEPGHLAGLYDGDPPIRTDRETYLPPLPSDVAKKYLAEVNGKLGKGRTAVPDGNHLRVLYWLNDAVETFRKSKLPGLGKELHVNIHESLFAPDDLPDPTPDADYGDNTNAMSVVGSWWRSATRPDERKTWAVLDVHHYHAWGTECSGTVEGAPSGRFACGDAGERKEVTSRCLSWASGVYRPAIEAECEGGLRLASAEFSAGTHHSVRHACNDASTLRLMLEGQVADARGADVELFWWSWKLPYGGAFRRAWSLRHLLYVLGVLGSPDEGPFHCGDHVRPPGEPEDASI